MVYYDNKSASDNLRATSPDIRLAVGFYHTLFKKTYKLSFQIALGSVPKVKLKLLSDTLNLIFAQANQSKPMTKRQRERHKYCRAKEREEERGRVCVCRVCDPAGAPAD